MNKQSNPWSEGVLLICTKCYKAISPERLQQPGNSGENLKMYLKQQLRAQGVTNEVRVVTSSCLNICIADMQAVSFASTRGETESFILHPERERDELLGWLKEKAKKS